MSKKRRRFRRKTPHRSYRKIFVIAVEGKKTEPEYFDIFNSPQVTAHVRCIKGDSNSSPIQVLSRMKQHLKGQDIRATDEAWLVVDKDQWTNTQLDELYAWSKTRENYGFALSNPKFEYWLLLHFEDGAGIGSSRECDERLKKHLPNYRKGIRSSEFTEARIRSAIRHAKTRDNPPCVDWPRGRNSSTVYRLVENILRS